VLQDYLPHARVLGSCNQLIWKTVVLVATTVDSPLFAMQIPRQM